MKTDGGGLAGAKGWARAALGLQRSRQAALRIPLRGNAGRVSTSRVAEQAVTCRAGLEQDDPGRRTSAETSRRLSSSEAVRGSISDRGEGGEEEDRLQTKGPASDEFRRNLGEQL
ncbi:hypothetical protein NDU88_005756 [Pleurodeles waltl]|uniref:Uncharacterized protein n=1 Tax=Pleurodeles waltl TaxID=8319 RepID=A0AAV7UJ11_PLEWA|nr:hypothetical protein NDU88_005756 [Pleurodeles waltl]